MSTKIVMPQLGESVAEGVIAKWLKAEGDSIERDEPIVEIVTDKVNAEIPSPVAGVLQRIAQPEGATVTVGEEIAVIGDTAEVAAPPPAAEEPPALDTPTQAPSGAPDRRSGNGTSAASAHSSAAVLPAPATRSERIRSSPLVRRLAEEHGIDLATVPGTGIGGRVSKADILASIERREAGATAAPSPAPSDGAPGRAAAATAPAAPAHAPAAGDEIIPLTPLRKIIADRMVLSTTTIPHAATIVEVDMTNVVRYRESRKDEFQRREQAPLSYVAFVVKAAVEALKQYPDVNSQWGGDHIVRKGAININIAVDAPDGLTTPVIHGADEKSLAGLSRAVADLVTRARTKHLQIEDMQGGTFTVNNTGALGSIWSMSIINPPQCAMLAAAAIVKRPVVIERDGQDLIAVRSMMNLSFSFDHRILDGGYASSFLTAVKDKLEQWSPEYPLY